MSEEKMLTMEQVCEQAKAQDYPKYIPGERDLICNVCGEPWSAWGVNHGDMTKEERIKFYRGKGCPSCTKKSPK